jgi:hypothetical protein
MKILADVLEALIPVWDFGWHEVSYQSHCDPDLYLQEGRAAEIPSACRVPGVT